jgi:hypothetical protein
VNTVAAIVRDLEASDATFARPPTLRDDEGKVRGAGFEFEYAGLSLERSAEIVRQVFGGRHVLDSTFVHRVVDTAHGAFAVEIDISLLKDKRYEPALRAIGLDPGKLDRGWRASIESTLLSVASTLVPTEIGTPPIPVDQLEPLDELRARLLEAGAKGTRASLVYAFGLHINPSAPSMSPRSLLDHLRAFLLLYPWLAGRVDPDVARRVTPFINPFPAEYARLVLSPDYPADDGDRLVEDYLAFNATRNRPLDMLPVLACLDEARIKQTTKGPHLVKPRPAYHYRMPNCLVDEPLWRVAREWNTWVAVERLAAEPELIAQLSRDYFAADEQSLRPFYEKWPEVLANHMNAINVAEEGIVPSPSGRGLG